MLFVGATSAKDFYKGLKRSGVKLSSTDTKKLLAALDMTGACCEGAV